MVVFMTDGHPTVGETNPQRIIKNAARSNKVGAKIFVFGVAEEINTKLLDRVAALEPEIVVVEQYTDLLAGLELLHRLLHRNFLGDLCHHAGHFDPHG